MPEKNQRQPNFLEEIAAMAGLAELPPNVAEIFTLADQLLKKLEKAQNAGEVTAPTRKLLEELFAALPVCSRLFPDFRKLMAAVLTEDEKINPEG